MLKSPGLFRVLLCLKFSFVLTALPLQGQTTCEGGPFVYRCTDEAAYLSLVQQIGNNTCIAEGFEHPVDWGLARYVETQPSVLSRRIEWTSNNATSRLTTDAGGSRNGEYGLFALPHGITAGGLQDIQRDGFIGRLKGPGRILGAGGWIMSNTPGAQVRFAIDGQDATFSNASLSAIHSFFGVVSTLGFQSFEVFETEGRVEDQKLIFGDDFVICSALPAPGDVDGDRNSDVSAWRPSTGIWYTRPSDSPGSYTAKKWGLSTDLLTPADYDGDGRTDISVWRPSTGIWYTLPSASPGTYRAAQWGLPTDKPVPGDYDGDGTDDISVWRPSTGAWFVRPSNNPGSYVATAWGSSGDIPVPGDYDGDRKTDRAVWRSANGTWYILHTGIPGSYGSTAWGSPTDGPVPGDYDGDGKYDAAVWRPSTGIWYVLSSSNPGTYKSIKWGLSTDVPVPWDFDGDGKTDLAIWRPGTGVWYAMKSSAPGTYTAVQWGTTSDKPISSVTGILQALP